MVGVGGCEGVKKTQRALLCLLPGRGLLGRGHLCSTQPWKCLQAWPWAERTGPNIPHLSTHPSPTHSSACPPPIHPFTIHPSFFLLSLLPLTLPRLTDIYCLRSTFCKGSSAGGLSGRQDRAGEMPSEHVTWAGAFCPHWGALGREWPRGLRLRVSL